MIIGVSFKIKQEITNNLWKIFQKIDIAKYCWYNIKSQTEVLNNELVDDFFPQEYYDGSTFEQHIFNNHYIVFLKLQAYHHKCDYINIHTYDDFIKSNCQLLILIYDCEFVEIYSKELNVIDSIYQEAIVNGYDSIDYITDSNNIRTTMDII